MPNKRVRLILQAVDRGLKRTVEEVRSTIRACFKEARESVSRTARAVSEHNRRLEETAGVADRTGGALHSMKAAYLAAAGAVYVAMRAVSGYLHAAAEQEKAVMGLETALRSMGRTTPGLSSRLQELAGSLQNVTDYGDEATISGQKFLVTYRDITDDLLPRSTEVMLDLAALMGGDVVQAANMLGKASMGMTGELRRVGITVDRNTYSARGYLGVLEEIETQVKGQARAMRAATHGWSALGNELGDVKERAGDIINLALGDEIETWAKGLHEINSALSTGITAFKDYRTEIGTLISPVTRLLDRVSGPGPGDLLQLAARSAGRFAETYRQEMETLQQEYAGGEALLGYGAMLRRIEAEKRTLQESLENHRKYYSALSSAAAEYHDGYLKALAEVRALEKARLRSALSTDEMIRSIDRMSMSEKERQWNDEEALRRSRRLAEELEGRERIAALEEYKRAVMEYVRTYGRENRLIQMEAVSWIKKAAQAQKTAYAELEKAAAEKADQEKEAWAGAKETLDEYRAKLVELAKEWGVKLHLDVSQAEAAIEKVKAELDELKKKASDIKPTIKPQIRMSPAVPWREGIEKMKEHLAGVTSAIKADLDFSSFTDLRKLAFRIRSNKELHNLISGSPGGGLAPTGPLVQETQRLERLYNMMLKVLERQVSRTTIGDIHINAPAGMPPEVVRQIGFLLHREIQAGRVPALA